MGRKPKLTDDEVYEIKRLLAEGSYRQKEIAKMFNITPENICAIKSGKTWKHIEYYSPEEKLEQLNLFEGD